MPQALLTAVCLALVGLVTTVFVGVSGGDVARHITFGIFSTLVALLGHSMMMFYLIGKGKAVKDAMSEGGHDAADPQYRSHVARIVAARKPVFTMATFAMSVTMAAAILGASVDTRVLPSIVHATIAYGAIVCNLAAVKVEIDALNESRRVVDEVNRLLRS